MTDYIVKVYGIEVCRVIDPENYKDGLFYCAGKAVRLDETLMNKCAGMAVRLDETLMNKHVIKVEEIEY